MAETEGDSYCAEADVVAKVQYLGDFTESTVPTETEVLGFMAERAAQLYALLRKYMGSAAPGPANYALAVDTTSDEGKALEQVLIHFNAVGAAYDALMAAGSGEGSQSDRMALLYAEWETRESVIEPIAMAYRGEAQDSRTHYDSEIDKLTVTSRDADGITFDLEQKW